MEPEQTRETVPAVGIDLGTTNSLVAALTAGGEPEILGNRDLERMTPSVVSLPPRRTGANLEELLVGRHALNNARRDARNTLRSVKRLMGLAAGDEQVAVVRAHVAYEVTEDPAQPGSVVVRLGERLMTPSEVSGLLLRRLKEDAETALGCPVTHAVVTVPAYFNEPQRRATARAAAMAGLKLKALLDEPTAAALSETSRGATGEARRMIVFDFGGGTLDVSLVQFTGRDYHVPAYTGDNFLGGDDIDRAISTLIRDWILEQGGEVSADDLRLDFQLRENAEQAKRVLCGGAPSAAIIIPSACRNRDGEVLDVDMVVTQDDFQLLLRPITDRIVKLMDDFLKKESIEPEQVSEVLMVGGSSTVPAVRAALEEIFERDGTRRVRLSRTPMEAVARGAAIYAGMITGLRCMDCGTESGLDAETCSGCGASLQSAAFQFDSSRGGRAVYSQLPRSLGIRYRKGEDADEYQVILRKGTAYPTRKPHLESFKIPSRDRFVLEIYEGDEPRASQNRVISILVVDQIPTDVSVGDPVNVEFSYDRNRTLLLSLSYPTSRGTLRPRWCLDQPAGPRRPDDPVRVLSNEVQRLRGFLESYRELMEPGSRKKLQEDLTCAEAAITSSDPRESERLADSIRASMFGGCGIASTLYLAEHTIACDDPDVGPAIAQTAAVLRQQARARDPEREVTRKRLEELVLHVFRKHHHAGMGETLSADGVQLPYRD